MDETSPNKRAKITVREEDYQPYAWHGLPILSTTNSTNWNLDTPFYLTKAEFSTMIDGFSFTAPTTFLYTNLANYHTEPQKTASQTLVKRSSLSVPVCSACSKIIENEVGIHRKEKIYHEMCFVCSECFLPLVNTNYFLRQEKILCEKHAGQSSLDPTELNVQVSIQPELYQIANYNIHPNPQIYFNMELPHDMKVIVDLVELTTYTTVIQGFKSNDMEKELLAGVQAKTLTGLKLNKKSVIKNYLKKINHKKPNDCSFSLKFTIDGSSWYSRPFKIMSSCSQLPPDLRDSIRPFAVGKTIEPNNTFTNSNLEEKRNKS